MMSEWCIYNGDGPLILMPEEVLPEWEGVSEPSDGRIVLADFRFAGEGSVGTDYDFACDIADTHTGFTLFGSGWILVPGYGNGSIAFFDASEESATVAVCIETSDDEDDETKYRQEYGSFTASDWQPVCAILSIVRGNLVDFHSTEPGIEVMTGQTCMTTPVEWAIPAGNYQLTMATFGRPYKDTVFHNYYYRWIRNKDIK